MNLGGNKFFGPGDAVFFDCKPWYGGAKGFCHSYERTADGP